MNNITALTNEIYLEGEVLTEFEFSYEMFSEKFYTFSLKVNRLSTTEDILPVTVSERIISVISIEIGNKIRVNGQIRSYNKFVDGSNRLILNVFAKEIGFCEQPSDNSNIVILEGYICKLPVYRVTPLGREIADMLLAINRNYNKSDYIPVIAWGRNAKYCSQLNVGRKMKITGRFQSREYLKKTSLNEPILRIAYEVSIAKIEIDGSEIDTFQEDNAIRNTADNL